MVESEGGDSDRADSDAGRFAVEVVYALPGLTHVFWVDATAGDTVERVIRASGALTRCPEIDLEVNRFGIYSVPCAGDTPVKKGDRVEIYRPLKADPGEARRRRAAG